MPDGGLAQLGERLPCKQEVTSSNLVFSTSFLFGTIQFHIILDSSVVEHSAVNRRVVGSSPTRGASNELVNVIVYEFF